MATARVIQSGNTQQNVRSDGNLTESCKADGEQIFEALAALGELIGGPPEDPPPEERPEVTAFFANIE